MADHPDTQSRRAFLRNAGVGAAAVIAAGPLATTAAAAQPIGHGPLLLKSSQKTLNVAFIGTLSPQLKTLEAAFKKQHPDVTLNINAIQAPDWDGFFTKLLTLIAGNQPVDMAYVATEGVQQFASKGLSVPIDDYVMRDKAQLAEYFADVHPALVESMMYNGHLYQLPIDFNAVDMYYNPSLIKKAGHSIPTADWSKDDFYKLSKAITNKSTKTFGYGWPVRLWGSWTPWLDVSGGDLLEFGRYGGSSSIWSTFYKNDPLAKGRGGGIKWGMPTVNSPAAVDALTFMTELTQEGIAPVPDISGGGALQGIFAANKIGMTPGGGFWAGGLHSAGMTRNTFDVTYWPGWRERRTHFGTAGYVILKSAADKDLAWEFNKFAVSTPAMTIDLQGNGTTPTRRSMLTAQRYAPTGPSHWSVYYPTLDRAGTRALPAPPYYNQMATIFDKYTTLAVTRGMKVKQALDNMQHDLENVYNNSQI